MASSAGAGLLVMPHDPGQAQACVMATSAGRLRPARPPRADADGGPESARQAEGRAGRGPDGPDRTTAWPVRNTAWPRFSGMVCKPAGW